MPHLKHKCGRTVVFTAEEVELFRDSWPCSGLASKSYWFEFAENGDLVDTNILEAEDGSAALALSQDASQWLRANEHSLYKKLKA